MIDETKTDVNVPVIEPVVEQKPRKLGRPPKQKEKVFEVVKKPEPIKRASVISEFPKKSDIWTVLNKDPKMEYSWFRKSNEIEINNAVQLGYRPAVGKEKIFGNPLESKEDGDGYRKERGDRILMCCPKHLVDARQKEATTRLARMNKSGKSDAQRIMQENKGSIIEIDAQSETVRERLKMEE